MTWGNTTSRPDSIRVSQRGGRNRSVRLVQCEYGYDGQFWGCNIVQSGIAGSYTYSVPSDWANLPVNFVSWGDAARFANWMNNGQLTGAETAATTEEGAYTLDGATSSAALMAVNRNPGAKWCIPTEDEWYKAAYYVGGNTNVGYWTYATQSDTDPSNTLSATGTNNANYWVGGYTTGGPYFRTPVGAFADSPRRLWYVRSEWRRFAMDRGHRQRTRASVMAARSATRISG